MFFFFLQKSWGPLFCFYTAPRPMRGQKEGFMCATTEMVQEEEEGDEGGLKNDKGTEGKKNELKSQPAGGNRVDCLCSNFL